MHTKGRRRTPCCFREEYSKREITVIVASTVEEDGGVIMDLEQMDQIEEGMRLN